MGKSALKSHMKGERHKNKSGSRLPMTITSFGFASCAKNFLSYVIMNADGTNLTYASKD